MSVTCCVSIMSFKNRKFSLDSSVSQDANGCFSSHRGSNHRLFRRHAASLEGGEAEMQELNHHFNGHLTNREKIAAEESTDRPDGLVSKNSFQKHNKTFHKLFPEIPEGENLTHTFICALQKEVLYHGKLFITENYVCFFSSVLLKETKVVIPTSSIQEVKKHSTALSMLSIQTAFDEKYFFVSLRNREMCYKLLQSVSSQAQESSAKSSPRNSSAENEADSNLVCSHCNVDDRVDNVISRQNCSEVNPNMTTSIDGPTQDISTREEMDHSVSSSLLWRIMEDVTWFFFLRQRVNFSTVFYVYFMLLVLLLLASGYMGLRMIALEERLNSLNELSLHYTNYRET
ncbi:GRAM domain-containing protein 2A-like isoform X2 [Corythoichthys intestinalis]|uniref:GRAM domain-containing protein 2A-like isoform X2 n=1 Tax=Corythoichthys intestinalis TaxID=161448 RepID=UPI0025A5446F|nr:GRAM domain-containing protein 2A-like isoform X2 [Corythoichthys intestinalis]